MLRCGIGGVWINIDLPTYIAIYCKPVNGFEIHHSESGKNGFMIHLLIVKIKENSNIHMVGNAEDIVHGTSILEYLVLFWTKTM